LNNSTEIIHRPRHYLQALLKIIEREEVIANNWKVTEFVKGRHFGNLEYRNNKRILRIYHNSNYLFTSIQLLCFESNSDGELTTYILECGVTYGIKVFDKKAVLFKSFYAKLVVLESFSHYLNSNPQNRESCHATAYNHGLRMDASGSSTSSLSMVAATGVEGVSLIAYPESHRRAPMGVANFLFLHYYNTVIPPEKS